MPGSIASQCLVQVDPNTPIAPIIDPSRPRTQVYKVPDRPAVPAPPYIDPEEYESQYNTDSVPIVIDNGQSLPHRTPHLTHPVTDKKKSILTGSCSIRAGYANMSSPYIDTDSVVSRYRDRKTNRTIMLAGTCSYVDANSRSNARPLHEEGIVCNYDSMVSQLPFFLFIYLSSKFHIHGE
jgi:actin-related protein 5